VETVRADFVEPARQRGWRVAVTLTPCAARWLAHTGELQALERATGLPVRSQPRIPGERSPHPPVDCYVVSPASANTVAKLALGIADNQALTTACEAIGGGAVPVIVFPRVNAAHARQPSWNLHLAALRQAGVHLVYGEDLWPLYEPRQAPPDRGLPWEAILDVMGQVIGNGQLK
jgi:hypothetical protein